MHASGVHATVAGVLLAFTVPVVAAAPADRTPARAGRALRAPVPAALGRLRGPGVRVLRRRGHGRRARPASADSLTDPVALGIVVGLVVGKTIGISAATWLVARFTRAELDEDLSWSDVLGLALLGGIGFTVSLLIGELAFGAGSVRRRARQGRRPASAP